MTVASTRPVRMSELPLDAPPMFPRSDEQLIDEFDRFIRKLIAALNSVQRYRSWARSHGRLTHGPLSEMSSKGLTTKILRIADAIAALCRGRHGEETGPLLRTMLLAYVNLKFIATHENREGAAMRYSRHTLHVRGRLKEHLVRPDTEGEAFPVQQMQAWDADEAELAEAWRLIDQWETANGVVELRPSRPPDKRGRPQSPLDYSWTGMTEAELFAVVGEIDAYRYYMWFSNEVHSNVVGITDVLNAIHAGRVDVNDETDFSRGPLALAAKYTVRSLELLDEQLELQIADKISAASDAFSVSLARYRDHLERIGSARKPIRPDSEGASSEPRG